MQPMTPTEPARLHGVPTTWAFYDNKMEQQLPTVRIGSIEVPCTDIIVWNEFLVHLGVVGATTGLNMQDVRHIVAVLSEAKSTNKSRNKHRRLGRAWGYVHPTLDGRVAPDSPDQRPIMRHNFTSTYQSLQFNLNPNWLYEHKEKTLPEAGAIEMTYYAKSVRDEPNGIWVLPIMTPQAERERLWHLEVMRRCPTLQCAPQWASWLFTWCMQSQYDPQRLGSYTPCYPTTSAGRFIGFKCDLREEHLRFAISKALQKQELPPLEGAQLCRA